MRRDSARDRGNDDYGPDDDDDEPQWANPADDFRSSRDLVEDCFACASEQTPPKPDHLFASIQFEPSKKSTTKFMDASELQHVRDKIVYWFGDWEVWIDNNEPGNVLSGTNPKAFEPKRNFDYFFYDKAKREIAFMPSDGMHKRMHNPMEIFPNTFYSKQCRDEDKLATYRIPAKYLRDSTSERRVDERREYDAPELHGLVGRETWLRAHPKAVSLLVEKVDGKDEEPQTKKKIEKEGKDGKPRTKKPKKVGREAGKAEKAKKKKDEEEVETVWDTQDFLNECDYRGVLQEIAAREKAERAEKKKKRKGKDGEPPAKKKKKLE